MARMLRSPLFLMALTIFIDITGFGLILPLLPFWAERLGANAVGVGLILTVYALAQFIFTPVLGALSDRYGRRPVIIGSLIIEGSAFAFTALAGTLPLLLIARFIGGLGASNIGSAQAVVSDITPPKERARGMGVIGAAIGMGFVVGPALGGVLSPLGPAVPFWAAMGVAFVNALLVMFLLPETRKRRENSPVERPGMGVFVAGWRNLVRYPTVARMVVVNLLFTIAFASMEAIFPLFTQKVFGWTASQNGYIFTYVGVIIVIMQGGLVGRLVKRWGEQRLLIAGLILLAAGLALLPFSNQVAILLITLAILSIGDGAVSPTVSTLLSFSIPADVQGETLGLAQGVGGLGRVIGPLAAGSIFLLGGAGAPFIGGAAIALIAMFIALPKISRKIDAEPVPNEAATSEELLVIKNGQERRSLAANERQTVAGER